jgi:hypothetical protein
VAAKVAGTGTGFLAIGATNESQVCGSVVGYCL